MPCHAGIPVKPPSGRARSRRDRGGMSQADQLTQVLQNAQSPDAALRTAAEAQLKGLESSNFALFVTLLAGELANEAKPEQTRRLAGLVLKNAVFSDDEKRAAERAAAWAAVDEASKGQVRAHLLNTLNSPVRALLVKLGVGACVGVVWLLRELTRVLAAQHR